MLVAKSCHRVPLAAFGSQYRWYDPCEAAVAEGMDRVAAARPPSKDVIEG